jgi:hypothetical protein
VRSFVVSIFCLVALAAGVGEAAAAPLPPVHDFALSYERGGGLAPSTQSLRVRPGGRAVAESSGGRAGERRVSFHLGARRIRSLQQGLRRAHLGSIPPGKGGCADCFLYSITYGGMTVVLEEVDVPPRLAAVFGQIEAIISSHTIPPNARAGRR